jgi:hypothetical protein
MFITQEVPMENKPVGKNPLIKFKHPENGQEMEFRIGISFWFLFFPMLVFLFRRQWTEGGLVFLILFLVSLLVLMLGLNGELINVAGLLIAIYLFSEGNKISGKSLLKKGWSVEDNDEKVIQLARDEWGV